jgi:hypothetical protein
MMGGPMPAAGCTIPARFNGPAASANGGYACGVLAEKVGQELPGRAAVTLHLPPPLGDPLEITVTGSRAVAWHGEQIIATVGPSDGEVPVVPAVPAEVAQECGTRYRGYAFHPFPTCFVCGPDRRDGDGLRLTPGPVTGQPSTVACTWVPDDSVADAGGQVAREVVWAALDCPGGWTGEEARRVMVLGWMTADIQAVPTVAERYVLVGQSERPSSRTVRTHTALYHEGGLLLAAASAVWVTIAKGDDAG